MTGLAEPTFLLRQAALRAIIAADGNVLTHQMCDALEQLGGAIKALDTAAEVGAKCLMSGEEAARRLGDLVVALHDRDKTTVRFLLERMAPSDRARVLLIAVLWIDTLFVAVTGDDKKFFDEVVSRFAKTMPWEDMS